MGLLKGFVMGFKGAEGIKYNVLEAYKLGRKEGVQIGKTKEKEIHFYGLIRAFSNFIRAHKSRATRIRTEYHWDDIEGFTPELVPFAELRSDIGSKVFANYLAWSIYGGKEPGVQYGFLSDALNEGVLLARKHMGNQFILDLIEEGVGWEKLLDDESFDLIMESPIDKTDKTLSKNTKTSKNLIDIIKCHIPELILNKRLLLPKGPKNSKKLHDIILEGYDSIIDQLDGKTGTLIKHYEMTYLMLTSLATVYGARLELLTEKEARCFAEDESQVFWLQSMNIFDNEDETQEGAIEETIDVFVKQMDPFLCFANEELDRISEGFAPTTGDFLNFLKNNRLILDYTFHAGDPQRIFNLEEDEKLYDGEKFALLLSILWAETRGKILSVYESNL